MRDFGAKVVAITGAGSGLGREIALAFARRGARLALADIDEGRALTVKGEIEALGNQVASWVVDVSRERDVQDFCDAVYREMGRVDVLCNNAGVMVAGQVGDISIEDWKRIVDINLLGVIYGCHAFIPRMKEQGGGHVINVASSAWFAALPEQAPYNATKAAVVGLSETLWTELAPSRIGVTVACPLSFNTNLMESARVGSDFINNFYRSSFSAARMSAADIAGSIIRAVERNRLYVYPQPSAKLLWVTKRLFPGQYLGVMHRLNRWGLGKPLILWLARHGLV
jgi:NAD(P)-dependent dehydrogenase (short-subunit alcohol dehydrogenase family)